MKKYQPKTPWETATFQLPRTENLPAEIEFADGKREIVKEVEGDWRAVTRWRTMKFGEILTPA